MNDEPKVIGWRCEDECGSIDVSAGSLYEQDTPDVIVIEGDYSCYIRSQSQCNQLIKALQRLSVDVWGEEK